MNQSRDNHSRRPRRGGFTLIELLIAMTVTLILIFALAQAFAVVGESVSKGRAAIEMSSNLRSVANRLQRELGGITVAVRPWTDDSAGQGYFEYVEGPLSSAFFPTTDKDWDGDLSNNTNPGTTDTTRGDIDDILAFTTRNAKSPFIGQRGVNVIQSSVAEVIWWIQYEDLNNNGIMDAGEKLLIYRRALLVRPDQGALLDRTGPQGPGPGPTGHGQGAYTNDQAGYQILRGHVRNLFNNNDVSVRLRWWVDGSGLNVKVIANSLKDLTRRENRFAHLPILSDRSPSGPPAMRLAGMGSPPPIPQDPPYDALPVVIYDSGTDRVSMGWPVPPVATTYMFPLDVNRRSITSLYRMPKFGGNYGEDVMVFEALCLDVQVFDPDAPIRPGNVGEALVPSDPGYFSGWQDQNNDNRPDDWIGLGAFADLGYGALYDSTTGGTTTARNSSLFSGNPRGKARLRTPPPVARWIYDYCTWSTHYERNGVDDDMDADNRIDEATNGFDDDGSNGVDDVGERETSPPYPVPLRGIQIRIRTWDPDSRQIRQATVVSDFVPE